MENRNVFGNYLTSVSARSANFVESIGVNPISKNRRTIPSRVIIKSKI